MCHLLTPTMGITTHILPTTGNYVHIYCRNEHWIAIAASNLDCGEDDVYVFDSVYDTLDDNTCTIHNLFGTEKVNITMMKMQKQKGPNDCGFFAIAVATSLVHSVELRTFKQNEMH